MQYQMIKDSDCIQVTRDDGTVSCIPPDDGNSDWRAYQVWLAEGNQPNPPEATP